METIIDCCSKLHRLLQVASAVQRENCYADPPNVIDVQL